MGTFGWVVLGIVIGVVAVVGIWGILVILAPAHSDL